MLTLSPKVHLRYSRRAQVFALATMLLLAASNAGARASASGTWANPRPDNIPFNNVLVVMVEEDDDLRRDVEELLAGDISEGGSKASAAFFIEADLEHAPRTQASMLAMVKKTNADALLVVRKTGETVKPGMTEAEAYINVGPQVTIIENPNSTEVWASNYTINETPGEFIGKSKTTMQAILYDIADNGRGVYKIVAKTNVQIDGNDTNYIIATNITEAMIKKLKSAKLIQK